MAEYRRAANTAVGREQCPVWHVLTTRCGSTEAALQLKKTKLGREGRCGVRGPAKAGTGVRCHVGYVDSTERYFTILSLFWLSCPTFRVYINQHTRERNSSNRSVVPAYLDTPQHLFKSSRKHLSALQTLGMNERRCQTRYKTQSETMKRIIEQLIRTQRRYELQKKALTLYLQGQSKDSTQSRGITEEKAIKEAHPSTDREHIAHSRRKCRVESLIG